MRPVSPQAPLSNWRRKLHQIIFEADTPVGWLFDLFLIVCILASVGVVMLESIDYYRLEYAPLFHAIEWGFTGLFTVEYVLRLLSVMRPLRYATSFFGLIDLIAILPTYLSLFAEGTQYLLVVRVLRVLRVFRLLKLAHYVGEGNLLRHALYRSRRKIFVFLFAVVTLLIIIGSAMYLVEGDEPNSKFTDIPTSIYWAVVTLTTVGYGDISPQTPLGKALAGVVMIVGYGIIAIPTGIVTAEVVHVGRTVTTRVCPNCAQEGHDIDAQFCKFCGQPLLEVENTENSRPPSG